MRYWLKTSNKLQLMCQVQVLSSNWLVNFDFVNLTYGNAVN